METLWKREESEGKKTFRVLPSEELNVHIYFVRHGETVANNASIHQDADDELSETGRKQSRFLAQSLKRLPIETIIASPFKRTLDTAKIIQEAIQKSLAFSELLQEIPYPKEIRGLKYTDPESVRIRALMEKYANNPNWHYSDEENFYDTRSRAIKALRHIATFSNECVLVVTHGRFLLRLLTVMFYGKDVKAEMFEPIPHFFEITNTGITIVEKENHRYKLLTWNDYAHLKELME